MSVISGSDRAWMLPQKLCELSEKKQWPKALKEWTLDYVYTIDPGEDNDHCLCNHWIREVCMVSNSENGNIAKIGNCCIKHFEKDAPDFKGMHTVSDCLKRIKADSSKAPNKGLIKQAFRKGILSQWEVDFCKQTARKRNLSIKQAARREEINHKLLLGICTSAKEAFEMIKADSTQTANPKLIEKALGDRVIRQKDADFLTQTWVKPHRFLSDPQKRYKVSLNQRIASQLRF